VNNCLDCGGSLCVCRLNARLAAVTAERDAARAVLQDVEERAVEVLGRCKQDHDPLYPCELCDLFGRIDAALAAPAGEVQP
jgi:hypothetical protein